MSILDRAQAKRDEQQAYHDNIVSQRLSADRQNVVRGASYLLETKLDPDTFEVVLPASDYGAHWTFALEGLRFEVCEAWHRNPSGWATHLWFLSARGPIFVHSLSSLVDGALGGCGYVDCDAVPLAVSAPIRVGSWLRRILG